MKTRTTKAADVYVTGGGTLYVFTLLTEKARAWARENVNAGDYNPSFPNTIFVEHRYARDLAAAFTEEGFTVR